MENMIRMKSVNLIAKLLHPLAENGVLSLPEEREIIAQLRNLAKNGETIPQVLPKLIGQPEAAEMLGAQSGKLQEAGEERFFPLPAQDDRDVGAVPQYGHRKVRIVRGFA